MTQEGLKRKLTAILSADAEGYSRLMGANEESTIRTLTRYLETMTQCVQQHHGRVVDAPGDNLLAEFASVVDAVGCAAAIQKKLFELNAKLPAERQMQFRIGINLGDVVEEGNRIYGDGVNIAARLEGLAEGGGICISRSAYDQVKNKLELLDMALNRTDFQKFFNPGQIAIIGVSTGDYKFGGMSFLIKLQDGGYTGKLYPINPKAKQIRNLKAYPDLLSLPEIPDLAIICVAARYVPAILEDCARIGLDHIHILTSGFKETGLEDGKLLEEQIVAISEMNGLKIIGPNCMGPYCPSSNLTAWGAIPGLSGSVGIISQSGGLTQRLTEYTCSLGIGIGKAVSFGNAAVLDSTDFLEAMAEDEKIRVIAIYLESVKNARGLLQIAKETSKKKPIILWKGGESEAGAATAASHTGGMAGTQKLWEAFCRQTGVVRVRSMDEWVDAIMAFSLLPAPAGHGIFLIGGGGGNSVAYSDTFNREQFEVPPLSDSSMDFLRRSVPIAGSIAGNPLDMWRTFVDAGYLSEVLELGYKDPAISINVVDRLIPRKAYHFPDLADPTPEIISYIKNRRNAKPTVFTIDSEGGDPNLADTGTRLRAQFCNNGIPAYPSAKRAARALYHLCQYHSR